MLDERALDEILPVPDLQELKDQQVAALEAEGFVITNFSSGGVFYHLLMICCRMRIELVKLARVILNHTFVSHATGAWLELKGADFSKKRKQPIKTKGYVTLSRTKTDGNLRIARGTIFKTQQDINGEELRYFVLEDAILPQGDAVCTVEVEAEQEGARYNVPQGLICKSLLYLDDVETVENREGWIIREGADTEDEESLRTRILGAWSMLATLATAAKFKNICEDVAGVLYVHVNDRHPRGQGTVDIIVTGTAGEASEALLEEVQKAADTVKGPYDDVEVKSSETVIQDVAVTVTIPEQQHAEGLEEKVAVAIAELMQISSSRDLNELLHADIIHTLMSRFSTLRNVQVTLPESDLYLSNDKVILAGEISVTVRGV